MDVFDETGNVGPAVEGGYSETAALVVDGNRLDLREFAEVSGLDESARVLVVDVDQQDLFVGSARHQGWELEVTGEDFVLGVHGHHGVRVALLPDLGCRLVGCCHNSVHSRHVVHRADGTAMSAHLGILSTPQIVQLDRPVHQSHVDLVALVVPGALQRRRPKLC